MFLIKCERASFSYDAHEALKDLNFEICAGDYVCVVGANGSGKSTLIKGLLGLKQPSSGNVFIGGQIKQNEIGYLPQSAPRQKDFPAGVYEVVLSGRLGQRGILPFYSKKDREIANENLKRLGLLTLKNRCFCELSGGQQQRVLLARALTASKKLLLLDEPGAGLDPVVTQGLYALLEQINKEMGVTIIMVSHDMQTSVKYAGKILHLNIVQKFFGKTSDYTRSEIGKYWTGGLSHD